MLPALFFILALACLFPAALIAGMTELGTARPLLSIAFVSLFFLFTWEAFSLRINRNKMEEEDEEFVTRNGNRRRTPTQGEFNMMHAARMRRIKDSGEY